MSSELCPCGTGLSYSKCCEVFHQGQAAPTAEQLMRSRYSAYALKLAPYLWQTHHRDKRKGSVQEILEWAQSVEFTALEVINTDLGQAGDKIGKVEFKAHYHLIGSKQSECIHETSRFRRYQGRWVYYDGVFPSLR